VLRGVRTDAANNQLARAPNRFRRGTITNGNHPTIYGNLKRADLDSPPLRTRRPDGNARLTGGDDRRCNVGSIIVATHLKVLGEMLHD
jgi:hypothetical protein